MNRFWSDAPADREYRQTALRHMATQSMEFDEHNIEAGYRYTSDAVIPDGTPAPETPDGVRVYIPDTHPGSPLPHAWLNDLDHNRVALAHLFKPGHFLLIAGEDGAAWCDAAAALAKQSGLPLDAIRIGHVDGDYRDPRSEWIRQRQIGKDGAVLVRPDRFVAWRSLGASQAPKRDLETTLTKILARS
jgi:2,4-dichlorophenol 6-monooxygenase